MKGLTQQLRELGTGERITVTGTERSDIHKLAKRAEKRVRIEKFAGGYLVTCVGAKKDNLKPNPLPVRPASPQERFEQALGAINRPAVADTPPAFDTDFDFGA